MCFLKQILYCVVILHTFKSPFNLHNFGYDKTDERDSINKRDRRPTGYILDEMHPPKPQTFKQLVLSCLFSLAVMCSCMQNTWQMLAGVGRKKFALDGRTVLSSLYTDEQQRCTESFTTRLPERRYKNKEKKHKTEQTLPAGKSEVWGGCDKRFSH